MHAKYLKIDFAENMKWKYFVIVCIYFAFFDAWPIDILKYCSNSFQL